MEKLLTCHISPFISAERIKELMEKSETLPNLKFIDHFGKIDHLTKFNIKDLEKTEKVSYLCTELIKKFNINIIKAPNEF